MGQETPIVYVVEDDSAVRDAITLCLGKAFQSVAPFPSAFEFLEHFQEDQPGCIVLELHLPKMNGHELHERLLEGGHEIPVIFISGNATVADVTTSMRRGALDFLEKPFDTNTLKIRVAEAITRDQRCKEENLRLAEIGERIESLTRREREVLTLVAAGLATKNIATRLGISHKTVEVHRSKITRRMGVSSVPQLVRLMTEFEMRSKDNEMKRERQATRSVGVGENL